MTVLQQAFHKTGASQCGYCIPGMVMAATGAIRANPIVGDEEIKERLGGNICRCTGYQKIFEAVELARDVMNGTLPATALAAEEVKAEAYIGSNVRRTDAPSKVTGKLRYAGDMVMPHMLHVQVLRSPRAHARIVSIDTSQAEAMEGVEGVITSRRRAGRGRVRRVRQRPADHGARQGALCRRGGGRGGRRGRADGAPGAGAIKVEYEDLPAVFDPEEAMAPERRSCTTPRRATSSSTSRSARAMSRRRSPNATWWSRRPIARSSRARLSRARGGAGLCRPRRRRHGAFAEPEHHPSPPHAGPHPGAPDQQGAHDHEPGRRRLRRQGGHDLPGHAGAAAMKTGRPVRLVFTREESIASTAKRHPSRTRYRMGLMRDGRIVASEITMICDGGAYGLSTEGVMRKAAILGAGPYDIPNVKIDTYGIYTNNTPSGAFRTFGAMQSQFATESHLDICAERLGLDPFEIRRINGMRDGAVTHTRQKLGSVSFSRVLEAAEKASRWETGAPVSRGRAAAISAARATASLHAGRALFQTHPAAGGAAARARHRGKLVRHRAHRDRRPGRRLGRDRRRRHGQGHHRGDRDRRGHPDGAGPDRRRRTGHPARGRDHRRQRHRPHARGRPRRRHAPDLHDRQCRGAGLPRCPQPARSR
jgi:nicotinate dehydrogenase large molybdopterin subunit